MKVTALHTVVIGASKDRRTFNVGDSITCTAKEGAFLIKHGAAELVKSDKEKKKDNAD